MMEDSKVKEIVSELKKKENKENTGNNKKQEKKDRNHIVEVLI